MTRARCVILLFATCLTFRYLLIVASLRHLAPMMLYYSSDKYCQYFYYYSVYYLLFVILVVLQCFEASKSHTVVLCSIRYLFNYYHYYCRTKDFLLYEANSRCFCLPVSQLPVLPVWEERSLSFVAPLSLGPLTLLEGSSSASRLLPGSPPGLLPSRLLWGCRLHLSPVKSPLQGQFQLPRGLSLGSGARPHGDCHTD